MADQLSREKVGGILRHLIATCVRDQDWHGSGDRDPEQVPVVLALRAALAAYEAQQPRPTREEIAEARRTLLGRACKVPCTCLGCNATRTLIAALDAACEAQRQVVAVLREHHECHLSDDEWVTRHGDDGTSYEMNDALEYSDSSLCERTIAALAASEPSLAKEPTDG